MAGKKRSFFGVLIGWILNFCAAGVLVGGIFFTVAFAFERIFINARQLSFIFSFFVIIGVPLLCTGVSAGLLALSAIISGKDSPLKNSRAKKEKKGGGEPQQVKKSSDPEKQEEAKPKAEAQGEEKKEYPFATQLRQRQLEIEDPSLNETVGEIVKVTGEIMRNKTLHKSNARSINKFSSYYMPTTLSLLDSYIRLEKSGVETKKTKETKDKIRLAMTRIKSAFFSLFDNMFAATVMDVSQETQTLSSVLASDGLGSEDLIGEYLKNKKE